MSDTGRRSARGGLGLNPVVVIGVLLPLLTLGALALVQPREAAVTGPLRPTRAALTSSVALCPTAPPGGAKAAAATVGGAVDGDFSTGREQSGPAVRIRADRPTPLRPGRTVRGHGPAAGALLAAEFGLRQTAATTCPRPEPETWFTGVGAGARHTSVLQLSNPDAGPAVADVDVFARRGRLDVPELRGVTVRGGQVLRIDLGEVFPRRVDLTFGVHVSRGRLGVSVEDTVPSLGRSRSTSEWLPGQPAPSTSQLLLGLPATPGETTLLLGNPGADETRVQVRVVTEDAAFAPRGLDEVRVPAETVSLTHVDEVLRKAVRDGALGIEVTSTQPVTAALRTVAGGDLSYAAPAVATDQVTATPVPDRASSIVLADAAGSGVATVTAYRGGKQVLDERVSLTEGSGGVVKLPGGADYVRVTPSRTSVAAVLKVAEKGCAVIGLAPPVREALTPRVRPDLS